MFVGASTTGAPANQTSPPDNAVNPAWRTTALNLIPCRFWDASGTSTSNATSTTMEDIAVYSREMSWGEGWMPAIREATPGAGGYLSEGDVNEPDFKSTFYGLETYERLLSVKRKWDPTGLFYAHMGVGSDEWFVTDQLEGLPTQNGRLCRVA